MGGAESLMREAPVLYRSDVIRGGFLTTTHVHGKEESTCGRNFHKTTQENNYMFHDFDDVLYFVCQPFDVARMINSSLKEHCVFSDFVLGPQCLIRRFCFDFCVSRCL